MNRTSLFQVVRLVAMIAAIAGIIYAVEYMQGGHSPLVLGGIAGVWFRRVALVVPHYPAA